ncbi:GNAT family N-acetyltransferase [Candidatus Dojkabacteria bacterium]|nr:GNAT family N-acetyltransferase [Candidatus Dojkabacteria bacterium]
MEILDLNEDNLDSFFILFEQVVREDFSEYSGRIKNYFLTKDYSKDTFRYFLGKPYRKVLLATEKDNVVGYLVGDQTYGGVGFISFLGVERTRRNNGIGRMLLDSYEKFCKNKKAHMVKLSTFKRLMPFYTQCGFKHIGEEEMGYWGTRNQIMGKIIGNWNEDTLS